MYIRDCLKFTLAQVLLLNLVVYPTKKKCKIPIGKSIISCVKIAYLSRAINIDSQEMNESLIK